MIRKINQRSTRVKVNKEQAAVTMSGAGAGADAVADAGGVVAASKLPAAIQTAILRLTRMKATHRRNIMRRNPVSMRRRNLNGLRMQKTTCRLTSAQLPRPRTFRKRNRLRARAALRVSSGR